MALSLISLVTGSAVNAQTATEPSAIERTIPRASHNTGVETAIRPILDFDTKSGTIGETFVLGAVHISGATAFSQAELAADYEPYLATVVDDARLKEIVTRITDRYRSAGYPLSYALLPTQDVRAGIVRIDVVEGRVGSVMIEGAGHDLAGLNAIAAPLSSDRPLRAATLERILGLIRDVPGIFVTDASVARTDSDLAEHVLTIRVTRNAVRALAYTDNRGTIRNARMRLYTSLGVASLVSTGDELRLNAFAIPGKGFRYIYGQAGYSFPIGSDGLAIDLAGSYGDQYQLANTDRIDGSSSHLTAQLRYPIVRSRALTAIVKLAGSDWRGTSRHDVTQIQRDRLRVARLGLAVSGATRHPFDGELWLARGLGFDGATRPGDPLASRPDAGGKFTKLGFTLQGSRQIDARFRLRGYIAGQLSSRPLLSIEEFALGGSQVGRAFDFNEMTGDHGFGGALELGYRPGAQIGPLDHVEFFTFVDGGAAFQHGHPAGMPRNQALSSAGGGARFTVGGVYISAEAGLPLQSSNGKSEMRAFFSASKAF